MALINRAAILLRYKLPAIDWINRCEPGDEDDEITLELANEERNVYLISDEDADHDESVERWIELNYEVLFENELDGWCCDENLWPKNLSLRLFYEWFNVECHSLVEDTVDEPIEIEDI
jgi:hypothetical protein